MGLTWKRGDITKLQRAAIKKGEDLKGNARLALSLSIQEGAEALREYLEAAETATGRRRVEKGGASAGRRETGNMISKVSHNADRLYIGKLISGEFGWFQGQFEDYFREQDQGEGNIPAAQALFAAFIRARENYRRRMKQVADGRTPTR